MPSDVRISLTITTGDGPDPEVIIRLDAEKISLLTEFSAHVEHLKTLPFFQSLIEIEPMPAPRLWMPSERTTDAIQIKALALAIRPLVLKNSPHNFNRAVSALLSANDRVTFQRFIRSIAKNYRNEHLDFKMAIRKNGTEILPNASSYENFYRYLNLYHYHREEVGMRRAFRDSLLGPTKADDDMYFDEMFYLNMQAACRAISHLHNFIVWLLNQ